MVIYHDLSSFLLLYIYYYILWWSIFYHDLLLYSSPENWNGRNGRNGRRDDLQAMFARWRPCGWMCEWSARETQRFLPGTMGMSAEWSKLWLKLLGSSGFPVCVLLFYRGNVIWWFYMIAEANNCEHCQFNGELAIFDEGKDCNWRSKRQPLCFDLLTWNMMTYDHWNCGDSWQWGAGFAFLCFPLKALAVWLSWPS